MISQTFLLRVPPRSFLFLTRYNTSLALLCPLIRAASQALFTTEPKEDGWYVRTCETSRMLALSKALTKLLQTCLKKTGVELIFFRQGENGTSETEGMRGSSRTGEGLLLDRERRIEGRCCSLPTTAFLYSDRVR